MISPLRVAMSPETLAATVAHMDKRHAITSTNFRRYHGRGPHKIAHAILRYDHERCRGAGIRCAWIETQCSRGTQAFGPLDGERGCTSWWRRQRR